jgi:arylsulfatase A-like enzyme
MVSGRVVWRRWRLALAGLGLALAACRGSAPAPRLLLLVTVDTLRADRLGAYGNTLGLTPRLDAHAAESVVFTAAYAPASFTVPSVSALMSGRYPQELGIWTNESGLPAVPTLATELHARGWRTYAVVSNVVLRRASGLAAGFDVYDDTFPEREAARRWPERSAPGTTAAALRALAACVGDGTARCFLWVHYQDPHGPYVPPARLRARYLAHERRAPDGARKLPVRWNDVGIGGLPGYQLVQNQRTVAFYRAGYDGEVRYVDAYVGSLLRAVAARGLSGRAVIVVAADHGEGLGEDDYWFAHGELLTDPLIHVPLMLRVPGTAPRRRDDVASLLDVFPTLLHLLEGVAPDPARPGRDLLAPDAETHPSQPYLANLGAARVPRFGVVDGAYKYVVEKHGGVWQGRLARRGEEDVDLSARAPAVRARLDRLLADLLQRIGRAVVETRQTVSPADRARLRALGYLSGRHAK